MVLPSTTHCIDAFGLEFPVSHSKFKVSPTLAVFFPVIVTFEGATVNIDGVLCIRIFISLKILHSFILSRNCKHFAYIERKEQSQMSLVTNSFRSWPHI